ncbi:MAG TPA: protein kinase [Myxococcota bacterium]|nr:protein kinase [Myxococcota bacterium]
MRATIAPYMWLFGLVILAGPSGASDVNSWCKDESVAIDLEKIVDFSQEGAVWRGKMREGNRTIPVVIFEKEIRDNGEFAHAITKKLALIETLIDAHKELNLPIVNFLGFKIICLSKPRESQRVLGLIFDLTTYDSLSTINSEYRHILIDIGQKKVLSNFLGLAKALKFCHEQNPPILFGDMDWSSIVILGDDPVNARFKWNFGINLGPRGSVEHCRAPECFISYNRSHSSEKTDVYAFSILMGMALLSDEHCIEFREANNPFVFYEAVKNGLRPLATSNQDLHPALTELLSDGWAHLPKDRPNMSEFVHRLEKIIGLFYR